MLATSLSLSLAIATACAAPPTSGALPAEPGLAAVPAAIQAQDEPQEIDATRWFGLEGPPPTLATLRGRAVLLEFWATW